ncbi:MAG TPA: PIN domain-containing protein [Terriglobales bacterium]|jgi:predicted nucleic acid-binding protein|nr:PIN domain-containing protein [Terriglobales bacterium]
MMVLVDTPVWSLALRRRPGTLSPQDQHLTQALAELIREGRVQMLGPIRQELLSGLREEAQFHRLRDDLRAFPENPLELADYEEAAQMNNRCRSKGIAGSAVDFLICAAAHRRTWAIFSTDQDFQNYASVLTLRLHRV